MTFEPIFIAANVEEAEFVEAMLEEEGIDYEVRPEAFMAGVLGATCLQGLMYEVLAGQAPYCRRLLTDRGLKRGVIEEDMFEK
jgi:hypothetical protein